MSQPTVLIIGAGPAGLTAAREIVREGRYHPIVLEADSVVGGISRTVQHNGNRIDIGGHRFFSKSDKVMQWWQQVMPLQGEPARDELQLAQLHGPHHLPTDLASNGANPEANDKVLLMRSRLSRIYFLRSFFDYPVSLSWRTFRNLGPWRMVKIMVGYLKALLFPIKPEENLEQFFINRFGNSLYRTFFKDYTEKVWGVDCKEIPAEWGAQRIKGVSILKTVQHAVKKLLPHKGDISQKELETSLIERFLYPKLGPGQMWEQVAAEVVSGGGEIWMEHEVVQIELGDNGIAAVVAQERNSGNRKRIEAAHYFSTMAVKDLVEAMGDAAPAPVREVATALSYRDFMTVGVLCNKLKIQNQTKRPTVNNIVPDNWIYVQEPDVKVGRLQIFNNWSPYMVADPSKTWIGMEYFVQEGDGFWTMDNEAMKRFAVGELEKIDILDSSQVVDTVVIRIKKAYPSYFGVYSQFDTVKQWLQTLANLDCIGRNGMHRYNNMDHSMLTAMVAVQNLHNNQQSPQAKEAVWSVNTEQEYHEEK